MSRANLRIVVNNEQHVPKEITAFTKEAHKISDEAFVVKTTIKKRLNKLIAQMEVNPTAEQTAKYSIAQTKVDVASLQSCIMAFDLKQQGLDILELRLKRSSIKGKINIKNLLALDFNFERQLIVCQYHTKFIFIGLL